MFLIVVTLVAPLRLLRGARRRFLSFSLLFLFRPVGHEHG
jgi:hypothetical protein